ncbi:T6SS phospholipase effector Tle1-like catalytic domain-containing protein, partial [Xanthovirga aplysinae]|uniref:phospholipase effector Tle1 domain-containing protein n=1 Tax=Xanthovirga aplysinae TaxID=2529853 RepID=UPI001656D61A
MMKNKNIVICYDGTGNEYGRNNTNVVKTFESLVSNESQTKYYHPGIGTIDLLHHKYGKKTDILLSKGFGLGLQKTIDQGYAYLMHAYRPGDRVYLFGFSRGAFTVRALAGMIHHFGLLHKGSEQLIPYVSEMYNKKDFSVHKDFKATFCQSCTPHFIGVWDTV